LNNLNNLVRAPLLAVFIVLLTATQVFAVPATEDKKTTLETTAASALLMVPDNGQIIFAKEPDKKLPMASVTKLMTLLLAIEPVEQGKVSLDEKVQASEYACSMGGSQIYLEPGEEFSYKEMLIAVAVGSANDCSVALAEHLEGSEEAFVAKMNEKAKSLGCTNTNFVNPTGLPAENHYTSASDMALILTECIKHPLFFEVSSIYEYDLRGGDFKLWNTNKLLKWYKGVDGGKTGWTNDAMYCLASTCERDNLRLIAVVLGTPEPKSHFRESIKLYNYGYARYKAICFEEKDKAVKTVKVDKGIIDCVEAVTGGKVAVVVRKGEEKGYEGSIKAPDSITAPLAKGQKIGEYVIARNGTEVMRVPLVAGRDVPKKSIVQQINKTLRGILE